MEALSTLPCYYTEISRDEKLSGQRWVTESGLFHGGSAGIEPRASLMLVQNCSELAPCLEFYLFHLILTTLWDQHH